MWRTGMTGEHPALDLARRAVKTATAARAHVALAAVLALLTGADELYAANDTPTGGES